VLELVASAGTTKSITSRLFCETQIPSFPVAINAPFSASIMPAGSYPPGSAPALTLTVTATPGAPLTPQVVNVSAGPGGQTSPFICWVAETVLPNELSITGFNADPAGADLATESVTIANVSGRTLDLTGCTLRDEAGSGRIFMFPAGFMLSQGAS